MTTALHTLAVETDAKLAALWPVLTNARQTVRRVEKALLGERVLPFQVERLNEEREAAIVAIDLATPQIQDLDRVWLENGRWSRFFLVTNTNGHIHSSMDCHTCFPSTTYAWLTGLSGLTEAEAVAEHGEILCSVCFPSAPVEWTTGVSKATQAAKDERAAAKAERQAKKVAKALVPEDVEGGLRLGTERLTTIHAAKGWLTDAADYNSYYPRTTAEGATVPHHPSFPPEAVEVVSTVLAERLGTTPAEEITNAEKRAAKRK
jgi:hypothetical protein